METTKEFFKDLGVVALIFVIFFLAMGAIGCGDGTPVYNDQGECIANCGDVDVLVVDGINPDDLNGRDTNQPTDAIRDCGNGPDAHCSDAVDVMETDVIEYNCPDLENGLPPEPYYTRWMPSEYKNAGCYNEDGNLVCRRGDHDGEKCEGADFCQETPFSAFPPCVCWDVSILWFSEKEDEPEIFYCQQDLPEIEVEEYFFPEIYFNRSFKGESDSCGVLASTENSDIGFYKFYPSDQEKAFMLFSEKIENTNIFIPAHSLTLIDGNWAVEVRREDGKIFAICGKPGYWND